MIKISDDNLEDINKKFEKFRTREEIDLFIHLLRDLAATEYRSAIDEYGASITKENEKKIKDKKEKMLVIRKKVMDLEEFFLSKEKELLDVDKEFKRTIDTVRRVNNYAKEFGNKFL